MNLENLPTPICDREKFQPDEESGECVDLAAAQELERKLILATKTLDDIIAGCCNPDVAIRRIMLELAPIRKTLKIIKS